jgi:hypothetical protein
MYMEEDTCGDYVSYTDAAKLERENAALKAEVEALRIDLGKAKEMFSSIMCLRVEGTEFFPASQILDSILDEAKKGYNACNERLTKASGGTDGNP